MHRSCLFLIFIACVVNPASPLAETQRASDTNSTCVTQQEYEDITRQHTELGSQETEMGCRDIANFRKDIYLEKRALHRRTTRKDFSASAYNEQLAKIEARENTYFEKNKELLEPCEHIFKQMIALKREVDSRGHCLLSP